MKHLHPLKLPSVKEPEDKVQAPPVPALAKKFAGASPLSK
jgi:hypothetical protein